MLPKPTPHSSHFFSNFASFLPNGGEKKNRNAAL
jgi:hypothetical protein